MKETYTLLLLLIPFLSHAQNNPFTIDLLDLGRGPVVTKQLEQQVTAEGVVYFRHEDGNNGEEQTLSWFDGDQFVEIYETTSSLEIAAGLPDGVFVVEEIQGTNFGRNILFITKDGTVDTLNNAPVQLPRTYLDGELLYVFPSQEGVLTYTTEGDEAVVSSTLEDAGTSGQDLVKVDDRLIIFHRDGVALTDGSAGNIANVFDESGELMEYEGRLILHGTFLDLASYDLASGTVTDLLQETPNVDGDLFSVARFMPTPNGALFAGRLQGTSITPWLFAADGTTEGTRLVVPPSVGVPVRASDDFGYRPFVLGDYVIFTGEWIDDRREVWISDGTNEGTRRVLTIDGRIPSGFSTLSGSLLSSGEVLLQVAGESSSDTTTLYRLDPTDPTTTPTEVYSYPYPSGGSPVILNDNVLLKERAFNGDTLFAVDAISGVVTQLGGLDLDHRSPLFSQTNAFFYESNVTNTAIDTIVVVHGDPLRIEKVAPHDGGRAETSVFTIGEQLFAYFFDAFAGASFHRIDTAAYTSTFLLDLYPDNAGLSGEDLTTIGDRVIWNRRAQGNDIIMSISDGTEASTFETPAQSDVYQTATYLGQIEDRHYFMPRFGDYGLRELMLTTGETRNLDSLLLGASTTTAPQPALLNGKFYAIRHNVVSFSPFELISNLMEIDPVGAQTRIVTADTTTNEETRYSYSVATDGQRIYFTHQTNAGANPAYYDPTTETVTDLEAPQIFTDYLYRSVDGEMMVQIQNLDQLPSTYRLSPEGLGTELNLRLSFSVVRGLGDKLLWHRESFGDLFAVDKETGDSARLVSNGSFDLEHLQPSGDGKMVFFRRDDDSEVWAMWSTDGTREGTIRVTEFPTGFGFSLRNATVVGDYAVVAMSPDSLYLADIETGLVDRLPVELTGESLAVLDGKVFFFARHPTFGNEPHFLTIEEQDVLEGRVFADANSNGLQDADEEGIARHPVYVDGGPNERIFTNSEGRFALRVVEGRTYGLRVEPGLCHDSITTADRFAFTYSPDSSYQLNFGLLPGDGPAALRALLNSGTIRCGFEHDFWLTVLNDGCQPLAGEGSVHFPEEMEFLGSDVTPLSQEENTLTFAFDTLQPNASQRIRIRFRMPDENFAGLPINLGAAAGAVDGQGAMITSDTFAYSEILRCAIDPNDKQVLPSRSEPSNSNYTQLDETLRYTIRFQNTGNDTAFTVRIQDRISESLDLETFKPLAASHPYSVSVREDRTVIFLFENILLPDSTTNLPGSQGFVTFEINAHPDLDDFSTIDNTAGIYFDFNQPVITNTVSSTLVEFLDEDQDGFLFYEECNDKDFAINPAAEEIPNNGIDENCDDLDDFPVSITEALPGTLNYFPNPTDGRISLRYSENTPLHGELYAANGVRLRAFVFQNTHSLNLEEFPAGLYLVRLYSEEGRGVMLRVVRR